VGAEHEDIQGNRNSHGGQEQMAEQQSAPTGTTESRRRWNVMCSCAGHNSCTYHVCLDKH
jgi:hypothetical protein